MEAKTRLTCLQRMVPKAWNLPTCFLPVVIRITGRRKKSRQGDFISPTLCSIQFPTTRRNYVGFFMWSLPVQKHIYIYHSAASEIMVRKQNLPCSLKKSVPGLI